MTEFALVAPILFFMLLGVLEVTLLVFVLSSAGFGAGVGARIGSEQGNASNADTQILDAIRGTTIGTTTLADVTEIDIFQVDYNAGTGALTPDPVKVNRYRLDGTSISLNWPATNRNVTSSSDVLGVTIKYRYSWKAGTLIGAAPLAMQATYWMRLEPQTF